MREHLELLPGSKVDVTIDDKNRLVVSVEEMDRAIARAVRGRV